MLRSRGLNFVYAGQRCLVRHQLSGNNIRCFATTDKGRPSGEPAAGTSESVPSRYSFERSANFNVGEMKEEAELPPPWEDPWLYVLGQHRQKLKQNYPQYTESASEFHHVEKLIPPKFIPDPPPHKDYPTPSGWRPPKYPPPDLPYYVRRTRYHTFPLFLECRRDRLNEKTFEFDYVEIVILRHVEGDVFACEEDLRKYLESKLEKKIATHVSEAQGIIRVKGADRSLLEQFLMEKGF